MNAQSGGEKSGPGDSLASRGRFDPYPGGRLTWLAHTVAGARHLPAVYLDLSLPPDVSVLDTSKDGFEALWSTLVTWGARRNCSPLLRAYTAEHVEDAPPLAPLTPVDILSREESHDLLSLIATHAHRPMPDSLRGKSGYMRDRGV